MTVLTRRGPARGEVTAAHPQPLAAVLAEVVGTFMLTLSGTATVLATHKLHPQAGMRLILEAYYEPVCSDRRLEHPAGRNQRRAAKGLPPKTRKRRRKTLARLAARPP